MEVIDNHIKHAFAARTDVSWLDFQDEVLQHFTRRHDDVSIGYWFGGEAGPVLPVDCEADRKNAIGRLQDKLLGARTHAVSMEVKNLVSNMIQLNNDLLTFVCSMRLLG